MERIAYNMENLVYCKKDYLKIGKEDHFEFKKANYYYFIYTSIIINITKPNKPEGLGLIFLINGRKYDFYFSEKEFYEHFLSYEKTKRKIKLDKIKNKKMNNV